MSLLDTDISAFLLEKHDLYNRPEFIVHDPISVPHAFDQKEDIEIIGFWLPQLRGVRERPLLIMGKSWPMPWAIILMNL
jgi:hypothetical protein